MKQDKSKTTMKKLIHEAEKTTNSIWNQKDPLEEALQKSSDEVLAEAIRDLLRKDLPN